MNQGVRNPLIHAPNSAASREEMALFMNGGDVVEAFPLSRFRIQIAGVLSKGIDCVIFEFQKQIMMICKINFLKLFLFINC